MEGRYAYRIRLDVRESESETTYQSGADEISDDEALKSCLVFAIMKALDCMREPPNPLEMHRHRCDGSLANGISLASTEWTGANNFDDCIRVIVDVDKLLEPTEVDGEYDEEEVSRTRGYLARCGIETAGEHGVRDKSEERKVSVIDVLSHIDSVLDDAIDARDDGPPDNCPDLWELRQYIEKVINKVKE